MFHLLWKLVCQPLVERRSMEIRFLRFSELPLLLQEQAQPVIGKCQAVAAKGLLRVEVGQLLKDVPSFQGLVNRFRNGLRGISTIQGRVPEKSAYDTYALSANPQAASALYRGSLVNHNDSISKPKACACQPEILAGLSHRRYCAVPPTHLTTAANRRVSRLLILRNMPPRSLSN